MTPESLTPYTATFGITGRPVSTTINAPVSQRIMSTEDDSSGWLESYAEQVGKVEPASGGCVCFYGFEMGVSPRCPVHDHSLFLETDTGMVWCSKCRTLSARGHGLPGAKVTAADRGNRPEGDWGWDDLEQRWTPVLKMTAPRDAESDEALLDLLAWAIFDDGLEWDARVHRKEPVEWKARSAVRAVLAALTAEGWTDANDR